MAKKNKQNTTKAEPELDAPLMKMDSSKASYESMIHEVSDAWRNANDDYCGWVNETWPDHIIVRMDKSFWKISYTVEGGVFSFGERSTWEKVELQTEWVTKNQSNLLCIKSLVPKEDGEIRIGGYAILWGDENRTDLHGDFFTPETEEIDAIQKSMGSVPFLFNHGVDSVLKSTVLGEVDTFEFDEVGAWFEARIKEHKIYRKYVEPLLDNEALYPSSGVLPAALKKVKSTGQILRWPVIEMTGTNYPAEHRMLRTPIESIKSFYSDESRLEDTLKSIGLEQEVQDDVDGEKPCYDEKLVKAQIELEKLSLYSLLEA